MNPDYSPNKKNMIELELDKDEIELKQQLKKRFYAIIQHENDRLKSKLKAQEKRKKQIMNKIKIAKEFQQLGIEEPLSLKLADIKIREMTDPYYKRSQEDNDLFDQAYKAMSLKSVLPQTTPFITV